MKIKIYTDGACAGNPGPGGWGAVIFFKETNNTKEISGSDKNTTNNRMELTAALQALKLFKQKEYITLHTDSNYLKLGITVWISAWKKKNWINSKKEAVKNKDLWEKLDFYNNFHVIEWIWVKAHNGDPGNERADFLATKAINLN